MTFELTLVTTAILFVVGGQDADEFVGPAEELWRYLSRSRPDRTALVTIPGMEHALAEEPGLDAAPQTPSAAHVDTAVTHWFNRQRSGAVA